jgi:hypothetical protein
MTLYEAMSLGEPVLIPVVGRGGLNALQVRQDEPATDGNNQILPQSNSQSYFVEHVGI